MLIVSDWQELLQGIADSSNDVVAWGGQSELNQVTFEDTCTYRIMNPQDMSVPVPQSTIRCGEIDFCGLHIKKLVVQAGFSFDADRPLVRQAQWINGFPLYDAVYRNHTRTIIRNLTIDEIVFEHPRITFCKAQIEFRNCQFYNIYAPSVEITSEWLNGSGYTNYDEYTKSIKALRKNSVYITYCPRCYHCIVNVRAENAGLSLGGLGKESTQLIADVGGWYYDCEINYDYTLSWTEDDYNTSLSQQPNWTCLELFPVNVGNLTNCLFTAQIKIDSGWELEFSGRYNRGGEPSQQYDLRYSKVFLSLMHNIFDLRVEFQEEAEDWEEGWEEDFEFHVRSEYIFCDGEKYDNFAPAQKNVWVSNKSDIPWTDIPDELAVKELYGDLRNPDIMADHGITLIEDDNFRQPRWNSEYDPHQATDDGYSYTVLGDYTRRIWPDTNDGIPFIPFWYYPLHGEPSGGGDVEENYITIYDMDTEQDGFENNGVILEPTLCRITEELNGGYNLTMEHPKDKDGKWRRILEMNIIKALGQLFIIRKVTKTNRANSKMITAYAEHISYHLNDYWLFPGTSIAGYRGQTLINSILAQMWDVPWDQENNLRYSFDITTNLDSTDDFRDWYEMPEGHTPWEMILGSNGFTSLIGGEVFRDNFKISINERMEGAIDNAFILHPDLNLTSITRTIDLNTFCTYFRGYDEYGGWFAIAWDPRTLPRAYPHNIVRSQNFHFDVDEDYYEFGMLARKVGEYFKHMCAPLVSFRINVQDLKNHPDYKDFVNYRFKVGDIGKVWDDEGERYYDLEISKTVKDAITGECLEVVIGSERSFTRPSGYNIAIDRNYATVDAGSYDPSDDPDPPIEPSSESDFIWVRYDLDNVERADTYRYIADTSGNEHRKITIGTFDGAMLRTVKATTFCDLNMREVALPIGTEVIE